MKGMSSSFKQWYFLWWLTMALSGAVTGGAGEVAKGGKKPPDFTVPKNTPPEQAQAALKALQEALAQARPAARQAPTVIDLKGKPYVLYGDLFQTGRNYAVVDLNTGGGHGDGWADGIGMGFAEWDGERWEARDFLFGGPVWRPEGWQNIDYELACRPATKPFWMLDLTGKGPSALVVASDAEKWGQMKRLYVFNATSHHLEFAVSSLFDPCMEDGVVTVYHSSGRRDIFGEYTFLRWDGHRLVEYAFWHAETPYNGGPCFVEIHSYKTRKQQRLVMVDNKIIRDGKPFAEFEIHWKAEVPLFEDNVVTSYVFEKVTGLPRRLVMEEPPVAGSSKHLEEMADFTVTGPAEAVELLSPKRKPLPK
ncbi:MAG: hypothetical protein JWO89_215 [Verrucomicrobiaceae bacterium]|nr:hypothetical protein [Verrucomicrobiaceae bacterium]